MNENDNYNSGNVRPYKATANLNTAIANPSANINDAMDVNIQNIRADVPNINSMQNTQYVRTDNQSASSMPNIPNVPTYKENINNTTNVIQKPEIKKDEVLIQNIEKTNNVNNDIKKSINLNTVNIPVDNNQNINTNENTGYVKKVYITEENKPKKKTVSLNMGPEFKTGLLIIVILLAFVLVLPMLIDLVMGY